MMGDELKTLKELKEEADELSFGGYTMDTLRVEAIRWIKFLRTEEGESRYGAAYDRETENIVRFIMDRFNLTEDDLE